MTHARDPLGEAAAIVGDRYEPRTLEPARPAVNDGPWFADDPAVPGDARRPTVTPTSAGDWTWDGLARTDPAIAEFARARWLGAWKPLPAVPRGYPRAREDFHRLAYAVVSNARKKSNGKFGLRYVAGGFGTPYFGDDEQVRVVANQLVVQRGDHASATPITTLRAAAAAAGVEADGAQAEHDSPELGDVDRALVTSVEVNDFLGDWFGFAHSVLEELRLIGTETDQVSRVQVWPGHFDPAVELGDADAGQRATYGASPGDATHAEPYLYVGPWGEVDRSDAFWNEPTFAGAVLHYDELLAADDARQVALEFYTRGYKALHG